MSIAGEKLLKSPIYGGWTTLCWITKNHRGNKKKEIKICIEMNENENTTTQKPTEFRKSSAKGKIHNNTSLPQ